MRIGIDGLSLTEELTGIGYYTIELARHLALASPADEIEILSPRAFVPNLNARGDAPPNLRFLRVRVGPLGRRWWSIGLPRQLRRKPIEVFHGTNFEVPFSKKCPTVLTIHDLSMLLYPETHEARRVRRARRRLPLMARAATMIVTPTESVRSEAHERLQIPLDRIVAVPEAARSCFSPLEYGLTAETRNRLGIRDEFLLFVGTVEPRKNLPTLLRAFEAVKQARDQPLQLVIAGRRGWLVDELFESLRGSPAAMSVIFTGYLSDEDLQSLYSSCTAFIYPSVYEGFGLPPLEAMACGAPVIASNIPAIKEVTGGAARLVAPENIEELSRSLIELLDSPVARKELATAGVKRAAEFSWLRTATATRIVYAEATERFRRQAD